MRLSTPEQLLKRYPVDPLGYKGRDGHIIPMREFIGYEDDDSLDSEPLGQLPGEDDMPLGSELQQIGPMNSTTHDPQSLSCDDGVDSIFGEELETREDSPSSQPKKNDDVNPAASIPPPPEITTRDTAVPLATSNHAPHGHSTRTGQYEVNETSLPRAVAAKKTNGDLNERPAHHKRARYVEASRAVLPKSRAVDRRARKAAPRTRLDKVKGLVRAARDIEAMIRHVRPDKSRRRILSSLRVAQLAIQEKMDSIQVPDEAERRTTSKLQI
ncbi:hypothetical protein B0T18DRAFT_454116 [Schizothecium vesticola]|uniref:Uncharacterized protein n=1 Tax=Schizothecium vesticola TaxID=314040 RepID=A0AA40FAM8_9PEZI|nr:hypothetical protein B0T18DRAFT_454116 [Schizothecium vesticola]